MSIVAESPNFVKLVPLLNKYPNNFFECCGFVLARWRFLLKMSNICGGGFLVWFLSLTN